MKIFFQIDTLPSFSKNAKYTLAQPEPCTVAQAPSFTERLKTQIMQPETVMEITGKFTGEPFPEIYWFHEAELIQISNHITRNVDPSGVCTLTIRNFDVEDCGQYTMVIKNGSGIAMESICLSLSGKFLEKLLDVLANKKQFYNQESK